MKKTIVFGIFAALVLVFGCKHETTVDVDANLQEVIEQHTPNKSLNYFIFPDSDDYAKIPNQDPKNPITEAKVNLGKMLFHETGIGLTPNKPISKQTYSCSSCHIAQKGFTAGRFQGIADGGVGFGTLGAGRAKNPTYQGSEVDAQGARPLPTINLAYVTNALWAGAFGSFSTNLGTQNVWNQDTLVNINFQGLHGLEANNIRALIVHRQMVNKAVCDSLGYTALFDRAFPDVATASRYSLQNTSFAIAAYFRTIFTNKAPFQNWLKGNKDALTTRQKQGALLFFGKAGCVNCHNSPSFNQMNYVAVGAKDMYQNLNSVFRTDANDARNKGRAGFTQRNEDLYKFKIPQLYNLKEVGFYMHGASKKSLREVVEYFNTAESENPNVPASRLSGYFKKLYLSNNEIDALTDFLENALYDPNLERYVPSKTMSGKCFPNNDGQSKAEMGCK